MKIDQVSSLPLIRPKMLVDEWTETYLYRVARANGISRPRLKDLERFRRILPETVQTTGQGYPTWCNMAFTQRIALTRPNRIRYCPACLMESRHIRSRWRLTLLEVCTIHYIRLKDDLAEPVMTRGYLQDDRYFVADVTDAQLWAGAMCPMPDERRHVVRIWSAFEAVVAADDMNNAMELLASAVFVEAMLDTIATKERDSDYWLKSERRPTQMMDLARRYSFEPIATREGVREFLQCINLPSHRAAILARMRQMLIEESNVATCISSLPVAMLRSAFLVEDRKRIERQNADSLRSKHPHLVDYLSIDKAQYVIGCSSRLLNLLVESHIIRNSEMVQLGKRRFTYLPYQEINACRKWYASVIGRQMVLKELNIDRRAYSALLAAKLLTPIVIGDFSFIRRADLTDLYRRLEDLSRPWAVDSPPLCPLFGSWMSWNWHYTVEVQAILMKVFEGKLVMFRRADQFGLSRFYVERKAIGHVQRTMLYGGLCHKKYGLQSGQLSLL